MKINLKSHCWLTVLGAALCCSAFAQSSSPSAAPPPSAAPQFSATELEKLAAPIALHPDPLISIILPASVYPLEIVQAARFVQDTNTLPQVDEQAWDDNVKAVAKFPTLIQKMNDFYIAFSQKLQQLQVRLNEIS